MDQGEDMVFRKKETKDVQLAFRVTQTFADVLKRLNIDIAESCRRHLEHLVEKCEKPKEQKGD